MDYHSAIPNHSITSNLTYGIYITDGTQMDDFGGDAFMNNYIPCGNGWPVDANNSPGYPTTAEDPITGELDIFQWTPPANWFSIYDENASSETDVMNYTYHAFDNEHVGDFEQTVGWPNDAVWPTSIIWRRLIAGSPLEGDEFTCTTQPEIPFPSNKIILSVEKNELKTHVYPNPFNGTINLINAQDLAQVELVDLTGRVKLQQKILSITEQVTLETQALESGLYILRIITLGGNVESIRLIKE